MRWLLHAPPASQPARAEQTSRTPLRKTAPDAAPLRRFFHASQKGERMPTQDQVRRLADNAWLLLISRAVAPLMVPVMLAAMGWVWITEFRITSMEGAIGRNTTEVTTARAAIVSLPQTYASRADLAALEDRTERSFDILLTEIRGLREDVRDLNRERRQP